MWPRTSIVQYTYLNISNRCGDVGTRRGTMKAMDASFPPDRWPATKIVEPDGAVRFVLKDGTEIHRLPPPEPVYDYHSGELAG